MATPKPGEIRCPTCHRSTPPAAFCTQCGSAIPPDARIRPRGMDRDELQERIRARRSGGDPYRRGGPADEGSGYARYEPEPEDEQAARRRQADAGPRRDLFDEEAAGVPTAPVPVARQDLVREQDDWDPSPPPPAPATPDTEPEPDAEPAPMHVDNYDETAYGNQPYDYGYEYDEWDESRERRSGRGWAIAGFLALCVLALLGGALIANLFGGDPGVAQAPTSSPTASATVGGTPSPTAGTDAASPSPTADPTGEPSPGDGGPAEFPDGFTLAAQPCLPGSAQIDGCDSNGARNSGSVQIWAGFENGTQDDVIGAALIGPDGSTLGTQSIDLSDINCGQSCTGYTYFNFSGLTPGEYEVEVTRNGEPGVTTTFTVE